VGDRKSKFFLNKKSYLAHTAAALVLYTYIFDVGLGEEVKEAFLFNLSDELLVSSSYNVGLNIKDFENFSNDISINVTNSDKTFEEARDRLLSKTRMLKY
jgi:hypothetical protein